MSKIGESFLVPPSEWLFETHGDVLECKRRAEEWLRQRGSYAGAEFEIEEFVRQWAIAQLINVYGYPKEWLANVSLSKSR